MHNDLDRRVLLGAAGLASLAALASRGSAGPLNPPPGAVTGTAKPLAEVEPRTAVNAANTPGDAYSTFKITQPGSYYLTASISGVLLKHGILIAASGVTLDLNGFELSGVPAMGAVDGVNVTASGLTNITVVNGSVRGWGRDGINMGDADVTNSRIEGVTAAQNARVGIYGSANSKIIRCSSDSNQFGISGRFGSAYSGCTASNNTSVGITVPWGSSAINCSAYANAAGFDAYDGCTLSNCSAYQNSGNGIATGAGCTVTSCSANDNNGTGITVAYDSLISDCTAANSGLDGIQCGFRCTIRANNCPGNGLTGDGAGIHATGNNNRIEGNNCAGADRGIVVDIAGNIIIRNTCSSNTIDWVIAANNIVGPILDRRGPSSAAINGFSAPSSLGSTDPNANFSF